MNRLRILLILLAFVAISCEKQNGDEPPAPVEEFLTVEPLSLSFTCDGGEKIVAVTSSSAWEASSDQSWVTIIEASDKKSFTAKVGANESKENARTATISVTNKTKNVSITIEQEKAKSSWGVVCESNEWENDVKMKEVFPGIWMSPEINFNGDRWKIRLDGNWSNGNVGYWYSSTTYSRGRFEQAIYGGDPMKISDERAIVVFNENNGTIGTLGFGVSGTIASFGVNNDKDIPMANNGSDVWYSIPMDLTTSDNITIRYNADPNQIAKKDIKVNTDGTYIITYDNTTGDVNFIKDVWSVYGDFNNWNGNDYMFYIGGNEWYMFNRHYTNGWKLRNSSNLTDSFGGNYTWNSAFLVTKEGGDIVIESEIAAAGYNIIFDSEEQAVTINQNIILR